MTDLAEPLRTDGAQLTAEPDGRPYATSDATRLLCAGAYLSDNYRAEVIKELYVSQYRYVAPSYGYDVVPVLGHALAAHRIRGLQFAATIGEFLLFGLLMFTGALDPATCVLLLWWASWCVAFLARLSTVEMLMTWLRPAHQPDGFDGGYPRTDRLTKRRIAELTEQQDASRGVVYYGGFEPFVGAGKRLQEWSVAVLLVAEPPNPLFDSLIEDEEDEDWADGEDPDGAEQPIPFTVQEITDHVATRLRDELVDHPDLNERIEGLVVERRRFTQAIARHATGTVDATVKSSQLHWEETYDAAREYLCVRIGSWRQELITSIFVGFDIRGNTLHTEFHPYVLMPINDAFHLVDQLPERLGPRLLARIARDALFALPLEVLGMLAHPFAMRLPSSTNEAKQRERAAAKKQRKNNTYAEDSLGLVRYAEHRIDRGARTSVRELAARSKAKHYFQESDLTKYRQVVERCLLRVIETFLDEHRVDLTDYRGAQSNILYQSIGNVQAGGDVAINQTNRARRARSGPAAPQAKREQG